MMRQQHIAAVSVVALLLLATYAGHVRSAGLVYEDAVWNATAAPVPIWQARSLAQWSWYVQLSVASSPQAFHAVNLGLFAGLLALTGLLSRRLGLSLAGAYGVMAVLAVHPGAVESAAYAAARPELIAALGVVGACLASLQGRWFLASVCVVLGLGGKETALIALLLIPLVRWTAGRPLSWAWATIPLAAGAVMVWAYGGPAVVLDIATYGQTPDPVTGLDWFLTQSAAAYRLIGVAISGTGMTIDADIDRFTLIARWLSVAALAALSLTAWTFRHSHRLVSAGFAWCLLSIAPRLLVQTPRSYLNEHQFLVPLLGLTIAGVSVWDGWQVRSAQP